MTINNKSERNYRGKCLGWPVTSYGAGTNTVEALLAGDHSRKRPALVTTTFVKPRLNCDLNFAMKSSRKRPLQKATATTFGITQLDFSFILKVL